ncbi:hypothetical protein BDZ85DRAFT_41044 [Elsinoe ampelina]|uniref:Cupin type-2 domain-containing protein n=1 Tax=Elsinoe ampelina TaxID=302913 RepID=A0A6A6G235_9PEZI|nr:hypothetical protein BDZ85DRAFT_41044 [Elsinoe ampelina]
MDIDPSKTAHLKISHASPDNIPWRHLGQYKYRILSDGTATERRLAIIESAIPPHSDGPIFHFHEMHDEGFYVTQGKVRFHTPGFPPLDAKPFDLVTVPISLPHKFSNPFDEEAVFINTITPGFFVKYFEFLEECIGQGKELTPEANKRALERWATVPMTGEMVGRYEEFWKEKRGEGSGEVNGVGGLKDVSVMERNGEVKETNGV